MAMEKMKLSEMKTPKEIENETLVFLKEMLGLPHLPKVHDRLLEDLKADSLDAIELVMELEEKFQIQITDPEITAIKTASDLVGLMQKKTRQVEAA